MDPRQALIAQMMQQQAAGAPPRMPYKSGPNPGTTEELDALQGMMTPSPDQQMMQQFPMQQQMPMQMPMQEPPAAIPDEMTDEDMLNSVQSQMGNAGDMRVSGDDIEADRAAVEAAPTDGNIANFVDIWGEENLPKSMQNPDSEAEDYATGRPRKSRKDPAYNDPGYDFNDDDEDD